MLLTILTKTRTSGNVVEIEELIDEALGLVEHTTIDLSSLLQHIRVEVKRLRLEVDYLRSTHEEFANEIVGDGRELMHLKTRRLNLLMMRQATQGIETPPATIMEIQDLKGELDELWSEIYSRDGGGDGRQ